MTSATVRVSKPAKRATPWSSCTTMSPVRRSVNERSAPRREPPRPPRPACAPARSARRRRSSRCSGNTASFSCGATKPSRSEAAAKRSDGSSTWRPASTSSASQRRFQAPEVVGGALALAAAREGDDRAVARAHELLELAARLRRASARPCRRTARAARSAARRRARTARSRARCASVALISSGLTYRWWASSSPKAAHTSLQWSAERRRELLLGGHDAARRPRRPGRAARRSARPAAARRCPGARRRGPRRPVKAPRRRCDLGQLAVLDRELGRGRDLDLLDLAQRALRERREPAQRLDLDVEHVDPHGALLGRREHVEQPAAQRELAALLDLVDALVAGATSSAAHSSRSSSSPTRSVKECGRSAGSGTFSDSATALTTTTGCPARAARRGAPRRRAARRAPPRAARRGAAAAPDGTRRRRRARGSSARAAAPARRAGPPPGRARRGRRRRRPASGARAQPRRSRRSAAIRYGRSEPDTNAWPPSRASAASARPRRAARAALRSAPAPPPSSRALAAPALVARRRAPRARRARGARRPARATSAALSRKRPSTYAETISGSVESGRPTPTRTRTKSAPPSSRLSDFSPLLPASPPPRRVRTSPNGRSISSWTTSTRSSASLKEPRAGPDRAPGVVHVGLRAQQRHARRARRRARRRSPTRAPLGDACRGSGPCARASSQRSASCLGDHEADVVARAGVLAAGIAQSDDQPVDRSATATEGASQRPLLLAGGVLGAAVLGLALAGTRRRARSRPRFRRPPRPAGAAARASRRPSPRRRRAASRPRAPRSR